MFKIITNELYLDRKQVKELLEELYTIFEREYNLDLPNIMELSLKREDGNTILQVKYFEQE